MPDPGARSEPKQGAPIPPKTQVVQGVEDRDLWERLRAARGKPVNIYDDSEGRMRTFELGGRSARPRQGLRIPLDMRPTPIPPAQLSKAYDDAAEFIGAVEQDHPILANAILNNPNLLPLLPEISMMLGNASPLGVDVTGSLLDAVPQAIGYRSYAETMFETPVQQMLWQDVISQFDSGAKDYVTWVMAGLNERGADRVSSLAFAWLRDNPIQDKAGQDELILRLHNWADHEQQVELHDAGIFGLLDAPQEAVENLLEMPVTGLIGWLGDPEEAIRRSGLTLGQQTAYQAGMNPDDDSWELLSGAVDAIGEVVADPFNLIAGVGAGVKAAKSIPLSLRAVKTGRLAYAARSAVPIAGRAVSPLKTRSITARVTYAFKAKTVDQLLDTFGSTSAGREAFRLLKEGNQARFTQRFPQFERLGGNFMEAAKYLDSPDELAEHMKHIHWVDNFDDPQVFNDAMRETTQTRRALENFDTRSKVGRHELDPVINVDRKPLELAALRAQMKLDNIMAKSSQIFVITDLPTKAKTTAYDFVSSKLAKGDSLVANTARRWTADISPGGTPATIDDLFETRRSVKQIRQLLNHYGVEANKTDDLLNKFIGLDGGERQAFLIHEMVPAIGDATKNPVLRYNLVEFYRRSDGIRAYAKGLDEAVNDAGDVVNLPIIPSNLQKTFPINTREIDEIVRRFNRARKLRGPLSLGKRGLVPSTNKARRDLVQKLRDRGTEGLDDEDLYATAYSWLGQEADPRSWMGRKVGQPTARGLHNFNTAFKKAMLGTRPLQWVQKVVALEEQIRAHVWEMPNMYLKPWSYGSLLTSNHYLKKADEWAAVQTKWTDQVLAEVMDGKKTVDESVAAIVETFGQKGADLILGDRSYRSVEKVRQQLASWLSKASLDKQQQSLIPGSNLSRRIRAWNIRQATDIKGRELLSPSFNIVDDVPEIMGKNLNMFFGESLATAQSGVRPFHWKEGMSIYSQQSYGHAWAGKIGELMTDPALQWGLRRMLARELDEVPGHLSGSAFMETATWRNMKGNIRKFFPEETDDLVRAERYLDEKVEPWIEYLLQPALSQGNVNRADLLTNLVEGRRLKAEINGRKYDIDLRSQGSASRKLMEMVPQQQSFARTTPFPEEIASVPFDFRFLDASEDRALWRKIIDWNINTFGERATQVFTRRPFYRAQRRKWTEHYQNMGIPDELVAELAHERAWKTTNYVMYDISEAPHLIQKLNNVIPFFGATYEVMSTWAYKMPVAVGGYWPLGVGAFGRKMDRLMRAFVNTGLVHVSIEDGKKRYTLQLEREPDTGSAAGDALGQLGYFMRRAPEVAIASLVGAFGWDHLEEGLALSESDYEFSFGNPLNPIDFGIMSFANAHVGLNPAQNWIINSASGVFLPAADVQRLTTEGVTTLADMADQLEVEVDDLARANENLFTSAEDYKGIFSDTTDPASITIPAGTQVTIPGSAVMDAVDETFFPFGKIDSPAGVLRAMLPGVWQWAARGYGLIAAPSDDAMNGNLGVPIFGGIESEAAMNGQLLEAFMHLESTDGIFTDEIFPKMERYQRMLKKIEQGETELGEEADALKEEIDRLSAKAIKRATDMAGGSFILRALAGGLFPNTGRAVRQSADEVDRYWNSKEFANQLRGNDAEGNPLNPAPIGRIKSIDEIDQFFEQVGLWLEDPTGDQSRAWVRQNNPGIFAYLQPKTFWADAGVPPEISTYEDYLDQMRSGQRKPIPYAVAVQRHLRAGVESDYWINFVNNFGNDPEEATSRALDNLHIYSDLQDKRYGQKDALDMLDDLHGGQYLEWLEARGQHADDEQYESVEKAIENQRAAYDMLQDLLDMDLSATMEPEEIKEHRDRIKTTLANFSEMIEQLEGDKGSDNQWKNPYEIAMNTYWIDIYESFEKATDPIWDAIAESTDTEKTSLLFENLKVEMNDWSMRRYSLFGRTDITYPSPLDIKWQRRTEEEKLAWSTKRATLPMEWLNLDDVQRILSYAPADAAQFFPTSREQMDIYTAWTVKKNEIEELKEGGLITESERRKAQDAAEESVMNYLREQGRDSEITYMNMLPIEKLYVLNLLPADLEYLMPEVRFIKESLAAEGKTLGSTRGDEMLNPLYQSVINKANTDPVFGDMIRDLGLTIADESAYDAILPKLIVGPFEADF